MNGLTVFLVHGDPRTGASIHRPILIAVLASLMLRQGFPRMLLAGRVVAFSGTVVIGLARSDRGVGASWGVVLCIVAAFAYSAAVVAQKPVLTRVSGLQVT